MDIRVVEAALADLEAMRSLYLEEARCQIVHYSVLPRGLADPFVILVDGQAVGHAGVWNRYHPGRLMEFFIIPSARHAAEALLGEVLRASGATSIEAQTNLPLLPDLLPGFTTRIEVEKVLFEDRSDTELTCPDGLFRRAVPSDSGPAGEWVLEMDGVVVAAGGVMHHYNPPYGDLYMEVPERSRRKGFGSYLVQELKRVCYAEGKVPAARCDPSNTASRRTLEKAGLARCGRLLVGEVRSLTQA